MEGSTDSNHSMPESAQDPIHTWQLGSSISPSPSTTSMEAAREIGRRTVERNSAIASGRRILPAPKLVKAGGKGPQLLDPEVGLQSQPSITPEQIQPLDIKTGRICWKLEFTKKYAGLVATLLYTVLTMLDCVLYAEGMFGW